METTVVDRDLMKKIVENKSSNNKVIMLKLVLETKILDIVNGYATPSRTK